MTSSSALAAGLGLSVSLPILGSSWPTPRLNAALRRQDVPHSVHHPWLMHDTARTTLTHPRVMTTRSKSTDLRPTPHTHKLQSCHPEIASHSRTHMDTVWQAYIESRCYVLTHPSSSSACAWPRRTTGGLHKQLLCREQLSSSRHVKLRHSRTLQQVNRSTQVNVDSCHPLSSLYHCEWSRSGAP